MERTLIFDCQSDMTRAAVLEDGTLCELHKERTGEAKLTESLFYGRIEQIRPSVCAAFVNIGLSQNAFLPLSEFRKGETPRCGDMLIVQGAAQQAVETKGLRVTARVNLAGKTLVLVPGGEGVHVSKKIRAPEDRRQLAEAAQALCPPGCGLIVRTASQDVTDALLREEAEELSERWQRIERRAAGMARPGLLWERLPLAQRLTRDMAGASLARIVTNSAPHAGALRAEQAQGLLPESARIEHFEEKDALIFDAFSVEGEIDRALRRRVWLPCGGYLVVDSCEAMTVIDVNSGKMTLGRSIEETALRVNLEAAREVARQIRLRNVGGMIAVDFIDMTAAEHREALTQALRQAAAADRSPVKVLGLTRLGLMEMTRKRGGEELHKRLCVSCASCSGTGELLGAEESARRALRQVRRMALGGTRGPFLVRCAAQTAAALARCENPLETDIYALGTSGRRPDRWELSPLGAGEQPPTGALRLPFGEGITNFQRNGEP